MLAVIILSVVAQIGVVPTLATILGSVVSLFIIVKGIWNFVSFLKSRASKEYVDANIENVKKSLDQSTKKINERIDDNFKFLTEQLIQTIKETKSTQKITKN